MMPMHFQYLLLTVLWLAYCFVHSLLISTPVTHWVQIRYPGVFRSYRLLFNIFSITTFIPIVYYTFSLRTASVLRWDGYPRLIQAILIIIGILLVFTGASRYDLRQFLGISQLREGEACQGISANCELDRSGVLGIVRHPWYTAVIILLWARDLDPAGIITSTVLTFYLIIGTLLEERKLVMEFGDAYRRYQQGVSMYLPIKWLKSKLRDGVK
jgi:protein-S-isoprenylcysteine O-methyltransferase Ste14